MAGVVSTSDPEGRGRFEELGLTEKELRNAVQWACAHVLQVTKNEPPNAAGTTLYNKLTRALRDTYIPKGWTPDNRSNHCKLVNKKKDIVVVVASGDEFTGTDEAIEPSTRSKKGKQTKVALGQLVLDLGDQPKVPQMVTGQHMWVLLVFVGMEEIRWELSLPISVSKNGHIEHWAERLIGNPIALTDVIQQDDIPEDDIDIDVRRRQHG